MKNCTRGRDLDLRLKTRQKNLSRRNFFHILSVNSLTARYRQTPETSGSVKEPSNQLHRYNGIFLLVQEQLNFYI